MRERACFLSLFGCFSFFSILMYQIKKILTHIIASSSSSFFAKELKQRIIYQIGSMMMYHREALVDPVVVIIDVG